jgi:hypothetical protein
MDGKAMPGRDAEFSVAACVEPKNRQSAIETWQICDGHISL